MPVGVLVFGALIQLPLVVALIRMALGNRDFSGWALFWYGCFALLSAFIFATRWWADAEGIERRMPYLPRLRLAWADVHTVHMSRSECVLHGPGRARASVRLGWTGFAFFATRVLEHVPAARKDDAIRQALEVQGRNCAAYWAHYPTFSPDDGSLPQEALRRWRENPFFVLGLTPECSAAEVERTGQKLLGMLALDVSSVRSYATPFGHVVRTADSVRAAMGELRDPDRRMLHEIWARLRPERDVEGGPSDLDATAPDAWAWKDAMSALGWRRS